jgi:hypothetical protein
MGAMKGQVQGVATQMKLNHSQANMVGSLAAASSVMGMCVCCHTCVSVVIAGMRITPPSNSAI